MQTLSFKEQVSAETSVVFDQWMTLPPHYEILNEQDTCTHALFLLSGQIEVYKLSENGKQFRLYTILPGEACVLNLSCILSNSSYMAYARTLETCEVVLIPKAEFINIFNREVSIKDYVFHLITTRLVEITSKVEGIVLKSLDERLKDLLLEQNQAMVLLTHEQIANRLGTAREVVSRLLKSWENEKMVKLHRGKIEILNL